MNQDIRYYHDSISEWNSKYTRIWHAFRSSTLNSLVTLFRYFKFITEQIVLKVPKHGTYIFRWLYTVNPLPRILKVYSIVLLFVRVNFPTRHNTAKFSVENFALKNCFRNCLYRRRDGTFFILGLETVYIGGGTGCLPAGWDVFHPRVYMRMFLPVTIFTRDNLQSQHNIVPACLHDYYCQDPGWANRDPTLSAPDDFTEINLKLIQKTSRCLFVNSASLWISNICII